MSVIAHSIPRGAIVEPFGRAGVELCRDAIAVVLCQMFHGLALGEILPDQAVGFFVGPAFPRMVGRREIKPGVGSAFDGGVTVEFGPVVGRDHMHGASLASNQLLRAPVHLDGRAPLQLPDDDVPCLALHHADDAGPAGPEHRVSLPVPKLRASLDGRWARGNRALSGDAPAAVVAPVPLAPLLLRATQVRVQLPPRWLRAEDTAGLERVKGRGWHSLRRKFATEMKHTPLRDLSHLGGWKRARDDLEMLPAGR